MLVKPSYVNISEATVPYASGVTEKECSGVVPLWTISSNLFLTVLIILFSITCCSSWAMPFIPDQCLLLFLLILISIPAASGSAEELW